MKISRLLIIFLVCVPLLLPAACGKGARPLQPTTTTASEFALLKGRELDGTALRLDTDDTSRLEAGDWFEVSVTVVDASDLYQFSTRLDFDPALVRPLEVSDGGFLGTESLFIGNFREDGIIPIAGTKTFAGPGADGSGELARVVFEKLVSGPLPSSAVRFTRESRFLVLKDSSREIVPYSYIKGVIR
jgi:hypothetical protein